MKTKDITKEMVEAEVNHNKETGEFSWKRPLQGRRKSAFGRQTSTGYAQVRLFGRHTTWREKGGMLELSVRGEVS